MKVLVTGAAGRLGSNVVRVLHEAGHEIVALDQHPNRDLPVQLNLANLLDRLAVYRLTEGCEAVVHLGNHIGVWGRVSREQVYSENLTMNAHVFAAADAFGIQRIVFASSIQAICGYNANESRRDDIKCRFAYLPIDSDVPQNPGHNHYALSKTAGEQLLQTMADENEKLSATALRFPALIRGEWDNEAEQRRFGRHLNFREALCYLRFDDAAQLCRAIIEKAPPGYHCYLPAQTFNVKGQSLEQLIDEHYRHIPLHRPAEQLNQLVDISRIEREVGWTPAHEPLTVGP